MSDNDDFVTLVEVGPRDGLQNEPRTLDASTRVALIERLAATGIAVVEAGSFVSINHGRVSVERFEPYFCTADDAGEATPSPIAALRSEIEAMGNVPIAGRVNG